MTFHYTDEAFRIHMPPTNTYAALPSPTPKNDDFIEEMVLKNNSLVTRRHDQKKKKSDRRGASSLSGFTHFFDNITGRFQLIKDSSDNPRAVPDQSDFNNNNNYYGLLPPKRTSANTINFSNFVKYPSSGGYFRSSNNKRSCAEEQRGGDGTVQIAQNNNKKLKAILVVDQSNQEEEFLTPPPPPPPPPRGGEDDSLVPDHDLSATPDRMMRKMMIKSAHHDHLVPGPDMSIAASNDAPLPASTHHTIHQHSDDSSAYLESQEWSDDKDEDPDSARRTSYYTRNHSSLHSRSEKKRRCRINKKMRALQELLPNSNKVDKASVLDEAIDYVKSLQLQLQLLSSGTHMLTSPPMMMPQIAMPNLNQFSAAAAAAAAMSLGMVPNQFTMSAAMHGFPHMACFPYMLPFHGGPSMTRSSAMAVPVVPETTSIDQTGSIPPPMSASNYSSYPNDFSQIGFESQLRHN